MEGRSSHKISIGEKCTNTGSDHPYVDDDDVEMAAAVVVVSPVLVC